MWVETHPSAQSSFQKLNVDNSCQKTSKIRHQIFEVLSNFSVIFYLVPNILSRIVECNGKDVLPARCSVSLKKRLQHRRFPIIGTG